jgi:hypothetical protein
VPVRGDVVTDGAYHELEWGDDDLTVVEDEEVTAVYPASWFLPEAEVAPRRPTRPVLMVIRDETTKEG